MNIGEMASNFRGDLIYAKTSNREAAFKRKSYPLRLLSDSAFTPAAYLSAVLYYKAVVTRNSSVMIGVSDENGGFRPMLFQYQPESVRKDFQAYVERQVGEFLAIDPDELSRQYRDLAIPYENVDFCFCLGDGSVPEAGQGLIRISLCEGCAVFDYDSSCIEEKETDRLQSRFASIAEEFVKNGAGRLADTDLIDTQEKEIVLQQFNNTTIDDELQLLHVAFSATAARVPDKTAIIAGERHITFRELDERSNKLARCLRAKGCQRNGFVAIALEKGIDFFTAFFGILKAGSAFLPIDVSFPEDRVQYMLKEADCKLIITDGSHRYVTAAQEEISLCDEANFAYDGGAVENVNEIDDRLFLLFTSGTTGRPKGVIGKHRSYSNLIPQMADYGYKSDDRVPNLGKVTFNYTYCGEVILAFTAGLTLYVPSEDEIQDTDLFGRFLKKNGISMLFATPQYYSMIDASVCRTLTTAGGLANQAIVRKALYQDKVKYFNHYGCTEGSAITMYSLNEGPVPEKIPIGRPIRNTHTYIMLGGRLCGVGMIGELCIGGYGLAEGYLNNPEGTAEKYEYSETLGERIYHTGDLGMFMEDGNILHMGRMDDQVKIRGIRIEVSEIENVIARLDGVTSNVITVRKTEDSDSQLCLYFTADRPISVKEAKDYLRKALPEYMVPTWVMQIDRMPVNLHGKIDKKALPAITLIDDGVKEPVNDAQREILSVFKDVLGVEGIGIDSNFFDCGGHSLKVTSLINKIDDLRHIRLTVSEIFREGTAENIAALLETKAAAERGEFCKAEEKPFYEMSPIQRRMYAIYRSDPSSLVYNEPVVVESTREIDVQKLENAFNMLTARHEIFRTTFSYENDQFIQRIADECPIRVMTEESDRALEDIFRDFLCPFELEKLPLLRVKVVRQPEKTLILADMPHIIVDRGTTSRMLDELLELYQGKDPAPVQWQYRDYSEWLGKRDLSGQKNFWLQQFEDEIPKLSLAHKTKSPTRSDRGEMRAFAISESLRNTVHAFAASRQMTDYMVMLSAFMILLQKYSGQEDVAVGTPISSRTHRNSETILGMFANTIALRGFPEKKKTAGAFMEEIRETALTAYQNAEYSLDDLLDELGRKRGGKVASLFDVMFVMQDTGDRFSRIGEYGLREIAVSKGTTTFDFVFNLLVNAENGYDLFIEYATDWFDGSYIDSLVASYIRILEELPNHSDETIGSLDVISGQDKAKILGEFNDTDVPYDDSQTIIDAFRSQVKAFPDRVAVNLLDDSLTYAQLDRQSNAVANALIGAGVRKGDLVGLIGNRSVQTVSGLLGILKAGAAYLPVDPSYPKERIEYMLSDSGAKVVVVDEGELPAPFEGKVLRLSESRLSDERAVDVKLTPDDLAYIIYTSGTTGRPKGTMLEHRGVINLSLSFKEKLGITEEDVVIQFANLSFDASVSEVFMALLCGARLCMVTRDLINDIKGFEEYAVQNGVTIATFPPQYYIQLGDVPISKIITAGSETNADVIRKATKFGTYFNGYGPTENTVCSTMWEVSQYDDSMLIHIGKPIRNVKAYILDGMNLCGIGMPGELCLSGVDVARGYLNRPELTAEKFIENPFGEGRLYRTGDLARWLPDGSIDFMGRIDDQVKIRGFRVELGEIEETIRRQPGIRDAAAVVMDDDNGDKAVYAYFVSDEKTDILQLSREIQKTLPDYMIPAGIMQLEALPLTVNGKLNKGALPKISRESGRAYIPPVTALEKTVAAVFEEVLKLDRVGAADSFYEIGGDSIKAIRVSAKLREKGYSVKVSDVMNRKTVENIAAMIEQHGETVEEFNQDEVTGEVLRMPIHDKFFGWHLAKPEHFNQSQILYGSYNAAIVNKALNELYCHHDALRIVFDRRLIIQPYSDQNFVKTVNINSAEKSVVEQIIEEESNKIQSSFDLTNGPLMKAGLFKTVYGDYLLITIHHLAVDIVSWSILLEDFETAYRSIEEDNEVLLPKKTVSYQEWARKINEYGRSRIVLKNTEYWKSVNDAVADGLIDGDKNEEIQLADRSFCVGEDVTKKLQNKTLKAFGCQIRDILLAALTKALHDITGQTKVAALLEGHGRETLTDETDLSRTVGWFTITNPVVASYYDNLQTLIIEAKETLRRIPDKGMGYGLVCRELDTVHHPSILLNYMGEYWSAGGAPDKRLNVTGGVKFAPENHTEQDIQLNCGIRDHRLIVDMTCNFGRFSEAWIGRFENAFTDSLTEIVSYCASVTEPIRTPSDFGYPQWSFGELQKIGALYPISHIEKIYPLTPMQEGMLYHKLLDDSSTSYVLQNVFEIEGTIAPSVLRKAVEKLTAEYDVFRTRFIYSEIAEPVQIVLDEADLDYTEIVWAEDNREKLMAYAGEEVRRGFDLEKGSPFRVTLIQAGGKNYMIWMFHHIITDGWCTSIIFDEFRKLCVRLNAGEDVHIEPDGKFETFVRWIKTQDTDAGMDYYRELLEGYDHVAAITSLAKDPSRDDAMKTKTAEIPAELYEKIDAYCKEQEITVNTVVETAVGILLQIYTRSNDVVFGKVVSGRNAPIDGIEGAVGLFINTIPVRIHAENNITCGKLLANDHRQNVESTAYHYMPLADIQTMSDVGDGLIQCVLAFENYFVGDSEEDELKLHVLSVREEEHYDIGFSAFTGDGLRLMVEYRNCLYSAMEIDLILDRLTSLIRQLVETPEKSVGELTVVTDYEKNILLPAFSKLGPQIKGETYWRTIIERFENQASVSPDREAVVCEDNRLTYAELNAQANRLAHTLRQLGVEPGDFVVIMAKSSVEMIASIYGVLKSGGAYVPVDPQYPAERINYILHDCQPKCIVTAHVEVPVETDIPVLDMTGAPSLDENIQNPESVFRPGDLAYVIYTSGTTGNPKGVLIEHRSLNDYVDQFIRYFGVSHETVYLQQTYIGFDASVEELFPALMAGGKIVVMPREIGIDVNLMVSLIRQEKINMISCVPILANELNNMDAAFNGKLILGGSSLSYDNVDKLIEKGTEVFNTYGPTEATVCASYYRVTEKCELMRSIPIGSPTENAHIYILSGERLCGVGVPGELCIAGSGVARGYLRQPELTAEKFIPNPFGKGRLYRSGDLARWLPDGNIEFMGRMDDQVKIRGFRVELGEIESVIKAQDSISAAAVVVDKSSADPVILAYVVSDVAVDLAELKENLRHILPEYMVPSGFMQIDSLPMTVNGKLNVRALPAIELSSDSEYVAPENRLQDYVLSVWKNALKNNSIGVRDNFFDVGGNSINMLHIIGSLQDKNFHVAVKDFHSNPTVEMLCLNVLAQQDFGRVLLEVEEVFTEKTDNMITSITENRDDLSWDEYNCFYRPVSIITASYVEDYYNIVALFISFYTLYGLGNYFYKLVDDIIDDEFYSRFVEFFNTVLSDKMNLEIETVPITTAEEMHRVIRERIDKQQPVLVPMDSNTLYYANDYKNTSHNHFMVIKGYDAKRERYRILDNMHLENGSSTVYKDYFITFDMLYSAAVSFRTNLTRSGESNLFIFKNTVDKVKMKFNTEKALKYLVKIVSAMQSDSIPYYHFEQKAVEYIYRFRTYIDRDNIGSGAGIGINTNLAGKTSIDYLKIKYREISEIEYQADMREILSSQAAALALSLNMKPCFFKTLNCMLAKCQVDPDTMENFKQRESRIMSKWQPVKEAIFKIATLESVDMDAIFGLSDKAIQEETEFRDKLIEIVGNIKENVVVDKVQLEAEARGLYLMNPKKAIIEFVKNGVNVQFDKDEAYELWQYENTAPRIGKKTVSDNWEVSMRINLNYSKAESRFSDAYALTLENGSKFFFGIVTDAPNAKKLELQCPELDKDYRLYSRIEPNTSASIKLRIRKNGEKIDFDYLDSLTKQWMCAKSIILKSKVDSIEIVSRAWTRTFHLGMFRDIKFSW